MKRALFKIGRQINIESVSENSNFEIELNVDDWAKNEKSWDFEFKSFQEDLSNEVSKRGTKIKVRQLKEDVVADFENNNFIKKLALELEFEHLYPLSKGLSIIVNRNKLKQRSLELLKSNEIKPAFFEHTFSDNAKVKIWAGIGEEILEEGGWYIFGNGRLILGPEQSEITGWTGGRGSDGGPKYHGQYMRFRGYVFFESDDASTLPWNTSKNGVDIDSPKYKFVRQKMIEMMKPVVSFLNQMKIEREGDPSPDDLFLKMKVSEAEKVVVSERLIINDSNYVFLAPTPPVRNRENENVKISYSKPKEQVDEIKRNLKVSSNREVGELTFEYFIQAEIE